MNLDQLFGYKAIKSTNNYLTLPNPEELFTPAMEVLKPHVHDFKVRVQEPNRQAIDKGEQEYKIVDRFLVEAVLNPNVFQYEGDKFNTVVGFLCALDVQTPLVKVYLGFVNDACLNLSVFNPIDISQQLLAANDFNRIYDTVAQYVDKAEERKQTLQDAVAYLTSEVLEGDSFHKVLGDVIVKAHKTPGMSSNASQMVDHLVKPKGRYYNEEGKFTRYDMYNALTYTMPTYAEKTASPVNLYAADKVLNAYNFFNE